VCREDSLALRDDLTFRDCLRTHRETAQAYSDLKRALAQQFPNDVGCYSRSKTDFITGVLANAGIPRARIEQIRRENGL
jgi:GrpB-like predicted nucleotidyltransferase (UPF0157 family)